MAGPHRNLKSKTLPLESSTGWHYAGVSRNQTISEGTFVYSDKLQHAQHNFPPLRPHGRHLSLSSPQSNPPAAFESIGVGNSSAQSYSPVSPAVASLPSDDLSAQDSSATLTSEDPETTTLATTTPSAPVTGNHTDAKGKFAAAMAQKKATPWRRWCLLAMVLALSISIPVGWLLRIRDIAIEGDKAPADIILYPTLVAIDQDKDTFTIDWAVGYNNCDQDASLCKDIDIFFDQNLLRDDSSKSTPASNNLPSPTFQINGTTWRSNLKVLANSPYFRTEIALFNGVDSKSGKGMSLQAYPFDHYTAEFFIYARNANADLTDLSLIAIEDAKGIAPGFNAKITYRSNTTDILSDMAFDISRGLVVRIYVIAIITSIWLVTLTLLATTVAVVLLGRKMASEILLVPVTTLFAFTQLRGTFPGAPPGFGAIVDFVGTLPCLALLTFCSVLLLTVFLFRNPEKPSPPLYQLCMRRPKTSKASESASSPSP